MAYQVTFNKVIGRKGRGRTSAAWMRKSDARKYADQLNQAAGVNARVVAAKKGTYDWTL